MDPMVLEYLKRKQQEPDEARDASDEDKRLKQIAALTGLGESLGSAISQRQTTGAASKAIEGLANNAAAIKSRSDVSQEQHKSELQDPTSPASRTAQKLAKKLFGDKIGDEDLSHISASDSELFFKPLQLKEQIEARKQAAALQSEGKKELRASQESERKDRQVAMGTQALSKKLTDTGISEIEPALQSAESVTSKPGDIAGFGPIQNTLREKVPFGKTIANFFTSKEGSENRQKVQELQNLILRARSGGAVTPTEADRLLNSIGTAAGQGDEELRRGIKQVGDELRSKASGVLAGYPDEVKKQFVSQGGKLPGPGQGQPAPHGQRVRQNGRTFVWDGSQYVAE